MSRPTALLRPVVGRLTRGGGPGLAGGGGVTVLGAMRTTVGLALVVTPSTLGRLLGVDRTTARRLAYLSQMIGVRELALGLGTLDALRRDQDTRPWVLGQALSDAGDAAALAVAVRGGKVNRFTGALIVLAGTAGAVRDVMLARQGRRHPG